jgi:hypothetical protein
VALTGEAEGLRLAVRGPLGAGSPFLWFAALREREAGGSLAALLERLLVPAEEPGADPTAQARSLSRLAAIHQAARAYRAGEGGRWPASLADLVRAGYLTAEAVRCPLAEEERSFVLLPVSGEPLPATPVAHEPLLEGRAGAYAVFGDGRIEWLERDRLLRIVEQSMQSPEAAGPAGPEEEESRP